MKRFALFALLAVIIMALAFSGCGGGGGGGGSLNPGGDTNNGGNGGDIEPPPDSGGVPGDPTNGGSGAITYVTGRVVDSVTGDPVPNVKVYVTNKVALRTTCWAKTGTTGNFQVALPSGVTILDLIDATDKWFAIDSTGTGANYPNTQPVKYRNVQYPQGHIILTDQSMAEWLNASGNLGQIAIVPVSSDNGGIDPPPGGGPGGPP